MEMNESVPLAPYATFKIGGPARYFCDIHSLNEIKEAVAFAREKHLPTFILGGGSNVLISDSGFDGVVLHIVLSGIEWEEEGDTIFATAGAGVVWDELVRESVERGYWGLENLSHIPGSVGASAVQNIGCYGVEACEAIEWVEEYDTENDLVRRVFPHDCAFGYRDSVWKHDRKGVRVITRVRFRLAKNGSPKTDYKDLREYFSDKTIIHPTQQEVRDALFTIRSQKLPDLARYGTAGSFFKNPVVTTEEAVQFLKRFPEALHFSSGGNEIKLSAPWIIDHVLNLRGIRKGNVGTWGKQALVLVNYGGASAEEIKTLAHEIQFRAHELTNIALSPEVV